MALPLVCLNDRHPFVTSMKLSKVIALYPVEKSALKNVDVQKAQERSHREHSGGELQLAAQIHTCVLRVRVSPFSALLQLVLSFPIRIPVMFLDEALHGRKSVMFKLRLQAADPPVHENVLMYLHIASVSFTIDQLLESAERVLEQTQIPIRVIGVLQPFAQKHESPINPISDDRIACLQRTPDLVCSPLHHDLVRVEQKNPLIREGD